MNLKTVLFIGASAIGLTVLAIDQLHKRMVPLTTKQKVDRIEDIVIKTPYVKDSFNESTAIEELYDLVNKLEHCDDMGDVLPEDLYNEVVDMVYKEAIKFDNIYFRKTTDLKSSLQRVDDLWYFTEDAIAVNAELQDFLAIYEDETIYD